MRLIDTARLEFGEFFGSRIPDYAILSHRWNDNEVSFQDFNECKRQRSLSFSKIKNCCSYAREKGFKWVWIDTCCIDKKSSAELTEAINSMYVWYRRAQVCYAYLQDVRLVEDKHGNWDTSREEFLKSVWFTRGWTLQELWAPRKVVFLDRYWNVIGSCSYGSNAGQRRDLTAEVSLATGIAVKDLSDRSTGNSVAKKMSWLSKRQTSRVEDMAYCMLGLFGVNMPLLYGEGNRAFKRLQLEIIKASDDESIFAWFSSGRFTDPRRSGILANSPKDFARSGKIEKHRPMLGKLPYSMTNKGLQYQVPQPGRRRENEIQHRFGDKYSLLLDCGLENEERKADQASFSVTITLFLDGEGWWRTECNKIVLIYKTEWTHRVTKGCTFETLYIHAKGDDPVNHRDHSQLSAHASQ